MQNFISDPRYTLDVVSVTSVAAFAVDLTQTDQCFFTDLVLQTVMMQMNQLTGEETI
jgi:hypothetical protein